MGVPMRIEPDYETLSCSFKFGLAPSIDDEVDALATPCFSACPSGGALRAEHQQCPDVADTSMALFLERLTDEQRGSSSIRRAAWRRRLFIARRTAQARGWRRRRPRRRRSEPSTTRHRGDELRVEEPGSVEAARADDRRAREGLDVVDVLRGTRQRVVLVDEHERRRPLIDERREARLRTPAVTMYTADDSNHVRAAHQRVQHIHNRRRWHE